jgi:conjugal transfer pilus assembly protein TraE
MSLRFFTEWEKLKVEKKLLTAVIAILAVAIIVLAATLKSAYYNQKVIVLPPVVTDEFTLTGNSYSRSYLEQIAFYLSDRLLTISPTTVNSSFDTILKFAPESISRPLKESLDRQAETIIKERIYQVFYPTIFDATPNTLSVSGNLKRFAGNVYQSETETTVIFQYYVNYGRIYITSFEAKPFEAKR